MFCACALLRAPPRASHAPLRTRRTRNSYRLFIARKPGVSSSSWESRLPDFVKRLEQALFSSAGSKVRARARALACASPARALRAPAARSA